MRHESIPDFLCYQSGEMNEEETSANFISSGQLETKYYRIGKNAKFLCPLELQVSLF
jgi:hypothetical protein